MSEHPLQHFINLVEWDQAILSLQQQRDDILKAIDTLKEEQQAADLSLEQMKMRTIDLQHEVHRQELVMQELDEVVKSKKNQLDRISYKEYQSLKYEIETLQERQHNHEDVLLKAWAALDHAKKHYAVAAAKHAELQAALQQKLATEATHLQTIEKSVAEKVALRSALVQEVPHEWIEKYTSMLEQVPDPVAPIIQDSQLCSACFYSLLPNEVTLLRRHALIICKGCFRFIYAPLPSSQATSTL